MKVTIRKVGNSRGVLIPKPLLAQAGIDSDEAELLLEGDVITLRAAPKPVRGGWANAAKRVAEAGDDALVWPEFANAADHDLAW